MKNVWARAKSKSIEEESSTYKGLGGAIVGVSTLKTTDKQLKKIFTDYKLKDTAKCMSKMQETVKLFLDSIIQNKRLRESVHKFFARYVKDIDAVAKMIPDFLKADLELMESLKNELSDTETNLREMFPLFLRQADSLLGQCDLFYVNYIFRFDYNLSDIKWDPSEAPIGKGTFADVHLGHIQATRHATVPVAMKICRESLRESTVSDILLEDRTLR